MFKTPNQLASTYCNAGPLSVIHIRPYHDGASNLIREHMVIGSHSMAAPVLNRVTSYPVFLRLILYMMRRLLPDNDFFVDLRGALDFLLKHPRRCYTNLFPSAHTWWLLCSVIILNGIDWMAFEVLNVGRLKTIWLGRCHLWYSTA